MIELIKKWAFTSIIKGIVKEIPLRSEQMKVIWSKYSDELCEKVTTAIEQAVIKVIRRAMEKEGFSFLDDANN